MTLATYRDLIDDMIGRGVLQSERLREAFSHVNRSDFIHVRFGEQAFLDIPLPIAHAQTISQPTTVAFMLELLEPREGDRVLDIGSGSGWTTALLAELVGPRGRVIGIEIDPSLVEMGRFNLRKYAYAHARIEPAQERILGRPQEAPYDRILVSAAARSLPRELLTQLGPGGILVLPIAGSIWKVFRDEEGSTASEEYPGFRFVPLRSP